MAAAKKNNKGNKTAHVLNLLTAPGEAVSAPAEGDADTDSVQEAPQPAGRPLLPPILEVAQANDDSLAQQIQQALEEELSPSEPPAPEPNPAPVPQPEHVAPGAKMNQDDIEKMLASMAPSEPDPAPQPEPEPKTEPPKSQAEPAPKKASEEEDELTYVNVMQILVEEKAARYIKMFGLCTCKHCEADVKALTLSNLVPKYVVLPKRDVIPMLTVYEGRFNSTIFAQLTRSCKIVMDHPHHNR